MPKICYIKCRFRADSLAMIEKCNAIIAEYQAAGFVLTLRQLYYQLVSRDIIANKQSEYKRVGAIINDARLSGLIDWNALEDRTRNVQSIAHWASPEEIVHSVAEQYRIDKWSFQDVIPEIWIEKDALVGVIEGVCTDEDVSYFSCRGYTSQSEMWGAAMRFVRRAKTGKATRIIHLGDHDPSGQDMSRDIEERIRCFMEHHLGESGHHRMFEFTRIALNFNQIEQYNPPPNPAKSSDTRFAAYAAEYGDESWELDALEPRVIADLIRTEIASFRDEAIWAESVERENDERELLSKVSERWDDVADLVR